MIFVGLDLSLTCSGVGIIDASSGHSEWELVRVNTRNVIRLIQICDRIENTLTPLLGAISGVAVEGYSMNSKTRSFSTGELGGAVRMLLHKLSLPTIIVPPKTLKALVASNGNADKDQMVAAVNATILQEFPCSTGPVTNYNAADAIGLAQFARMYFHPPRMSVTARTALKKRLDAVEQLPLGKPRR